MPRASAKPPRAAPLPSTFPAGVAPLTDEDVRALTDPGSFERGRSYFRTGKIFDGVRRGAVLRARCRGSSGGPYRVEATLAAGDARHRPTDNPVAVGCDCPRGGFCKHIVALLLTWIAAPDAFEERPPLADVLAAKSREELVALVELLLAEAPDLEDLVLLPAPIAVADAADADEPVDEAAIRRQIDAALDVGDEDDRTGGWGFDRYGDGPGAFDAGRLERLAALGEAYAATGRWRNALTVCATLIERVAPEFDEAWFDEEGVLAAVLARSDRVLAAALDAQGGLPEDRRLTADERGRLLDALVELWEADVEAGGQGVAEEGQAAIARSATVDEQRAVGGRVRAAIRPQVNPYDGRDWVNRAAIGFLSRLAGDAGLSDEELLAEYTGAELWEEAAETLLRMGRVDEAVALAGRRLAMAADLTRFADRLIEVGEPRRIEQAISLVDGRLWEREGRNARDDEVALEWLQRRYGEQGQPAQALDAARRRFKLAPGKATYDAVRAAAALPGHAADPWPELRPTLLKTLRGRSDWAAVIDVHLEAGEEAAALAVLKERAKKKTQADSLGAGWGYGWTSASDGPEARVAAAAERDFPDAAVALYRRLADRQIEARQRPAYREAAAFLARVKAILEQNGRGDDWRTLISDLRREQKRLRALREELDALGLS